LVDAAEGQAQAQHTFASPFFVETADASHRQVVQRDHSNKLSDKLAVIDHWETREAGLGRA
jgi:hypothetical protein